MPANVNGDVARVIVVGFDGESVRSGEVARCTVVVPFVVVLSVEKIGDVARVERVDGCDARGAFTSPVYGNVSYEFVPML